MRSLAGSRSFRLLALALCLALAGCGNDGGDLTSPGTGTLEIRTDATGAADTDSVTITVDGTTAGRLGPIDTLQVTALAPGDHQVALVDLPAGCIVGGGAERTATVSAGDVATLDFPITCVNRPTLIQVSAGLTHTCALRGDGRALCWGDNSQGALGTGSTTPPALSPVGVAGGFAFRSIDAGLGFTCATTADDAAWCWGANNAGQIGDGTQDTRRLSPTKVAGGLAFRSISAGGVGACGLTTGGRAYCWGLNTTGQRGTPFDPGGASPPDSVRTDQTFASLQIGGDHTCAVTDAGAAFCWGLNGNGQLGEGETPLARGTPQAVVGGIAFRAVAVAISGNHTCGLSLDGQAYCWGWNNQGQLGNGTFQQSSVPVAVAGGLEFTALDAGQFHTCGVSEGGEAWCWGANSAGQLGDGTNSASSQPVPVAGGLRFDSISAGQLHTCALTGAGEAWCWGDGGVLGSGSNAPSAVPVRVSLP